MASNDERLCLNIYLRHINDVPININVAKAENTMTAVNDIPNIYARTE